MKTERVNENWNC